MRAGECATWRDTLQPCQLVLLAWVYDLPMFRAVLVVAAAALLIFAGYFLLSSLPRQLETNPCGTSLQGQDC